MSALRATADLVVSGEGDVAALAAPPLRARPGDPTGPESAPVPDGAWRLGLAAFAASFRLDHDVTLDLSSRALRARGGACFDRPLDPAATVLACATRALAAAGAGIRGTWTESAPGETPTGDPLGDAEPLLAQLPASDEGLFARYAFAEAALACARVGLADRTAPPAADVFLDGHAFAGVIAVLSARAAAFSGRIDAAFALLPRVDAGADDQRVPAEHGSSRATLLADATRAFIAGNAADRGEVHRILARAHMLPREGLDRIDAGTVLLAAYGLLGLGEVSAAERLVTGFDWDTAMVVDRALVYELLAHGAIRAEDAEAAAAWLARAEAFDGDPIAAATLDRTRSRVALFAGEADAAIAFADRAVETAEGEGRAIEAAEGRMLAATARIAVGRRADAAHVLEPMTLDADREGFRSVRRHAGRVLRATGRRIRPAPGTSLSTREAEVLDLLLQGRGNAEIAGILHISEHTVRVHVSRVLAAHGAPSRLALIAHARWPDGAPAVEAWTDLTARQRAVVAELVAGRADAEIGARLGISERTVEKHVDDVKRRWGVRTRVDLVLHAASV